MNSRSCGGWHVVRPVAPQHGVSESRKEEIKGRLQFLTAMVKCHSEELLYGV